MILEAFSGKLRNEYEPSRTSEELLHEWLSEVLSDVPSPDDKVAQVIHAEITRISVDGERWFVGRSQTGNKLLDSLYSYCKSYDNWQFSRWVHHVRASDFPIA